MTQIMSELIKLSNTYGSDERYVVKGGGNTSVKDGSVMYVKASGHALATISESGFVKMDLEKLGAMWSKDYSLDEKLREKEVLQDLMDSRVKGETLRPSVEALLHSLIPFRYIVHLHPALVNGLTCSVSGKDGMKHIFPDALWIGIVNPGFILAKTVRDAMSGYMKEYNHSPSIIFLQNHGVFVGSDSAHGIDEIYTHIMKTLEHSLIRKPNFAQVKVKENQVSKVQSMIKEATNSTTDWLFLINHEIVSYLENEKSFYAISSSYTPDHIVYSSLAPLWVSEESYKSKDALSSLQKALEEYRSKNKVSPKVIAIQKFGIYCLNESARTLFIDTIKVAVFTESFGGPRFMEDEYINFIRDWEVENYRAKVNS